jgi:hypothetical protein
MFKKIKTTMLKKIGILFILFFSLCLVSYSKPYTVEQFTTYDSSIKLIEDGKIQISKTASIRNIHDSGIIPGQVEFKFYHSKNNDFTISDYKVTDRYGEEIPSKLVKTKEYTSLILTIFTPILPGFEYQIHLDYTITYEPSGIFFKRVQIPLKESTALPILDGDVVIELPRGKYFTYVSEKNASIVQNTASLSITKDSPETLIFEYSFLPLRFGNVSGSLVFWSLINIILLLILVVEVRKEIKRLSSGKKKK